MEHKIHLDRKFFEPIKEGKITLLVFDKKNIGEWKSGDYVYMNYGAYEVSASIKNTYVKAYEDITDEEANKMGFLNKDFLADDIIRRFNIDSLDFFLNDLKGRFFFIIEVEAKDYRPEQNTYYTKNMTANDKMYFYSDGDFL